MLEKKGAMIDEILLHHQNTVESNTIVVHERFKRKFTCNVSDASRLWMCWGIWVVRARLKVFSGLAGNHTNAVTCSWLERSVVQTAWCRGKCYQLWETNPGLLSISPQTRATVPLCFTFRYYDLTRKIRATKNLFSISLVLLCFDLSSLLIKFFLT